MISVSDFCVLVFVLAVAFMIVMATVKIIPAVSRYIDRANPADKIDCVCKNKYLSFNFSGANTRNEKDHQLTSTVNGHEHN